MVSLLLTVLVAFVILALIYWAIHQIAGAFGLPAPIVTVLDVVLVIVAILLLLSLLTGSVPARLHW